jgi:Fe-S-cluster containining protein
MLPWRLRDLARGDGLAALSFEDPDRAARVRLRSEAAVAVYADQFPGDRVTGILGASEQDQARFESFANDDPCPALDPSTGTCDLYTARPLTCRIFGPPVMTDDGLGMCELCFVGAGEQAISAGEMYLAHASLEDELIDEAEAGGALRGSTIVAYALVR